MSKATDILLSLKAPATLDSEQVTELKQSWLSAQGVARETTDENYKLRLKLADANRKLNSLANHNALQQPEITRLRAELAKANERVKELEAHNDMLMDVSWQMKEGKPDAFYKIKDARSTEPCDALNKFAIEKKRESISELNTYFVNRANREGEMLPIYFPDWCNDFREQLRKEQEQ